MFNIGGKIVTNRMLLGTSRYPSPAILREAILASKTDIITVSLRREIPGHTKGRFWDIIKDLNINILPNTAGCHSAAEAITTAHMARELFQTNWVKLEVIGDNNTLQPDPFGTVEAAKQLCKDGFEVFPYTTEDLVVAEKLVDAGCKIIMPWGSPIGSGQGIRCPEAIRAMRSKFPDISLILDAGIGKTSDATLAMELGCDAVLLNTAIANAYEPVQAAKAFSLATEAGRLGYESGLMKPRETAVPSTPNIGKPFWQEHVQ